MEFLAVGEVLRPQGLAGEVRVRSLSNDPNRCKNLKVVYIDQFPTRILSCRVEGKFVYFKFSGIEDRDSAERLRGKLLYIDRVNAVPLGEDEYFVADLIGCVVQTEEGEQLGTITSVEGNAAADLITAKRANGKDMRFVFLKKILVKVDIASKSFIVNKQELDRVCVYDD